MVHKKQILTLGLIMSFLVLSLSGSYLHYVLADGGPDDEYEDNDDEATAVLLTPGTYEDLKLLYEDYDDYFKFNVPAGEILTVELESNTTDYFVYLALLEYNSDYDYYQQIEWRSYYYLMDGPATVTFYNTGSDAEMIYLHVDFPSIYTVGEGLTYEFTVSLVDPIIDAYYSYGVEESDDLEFTMTNEIAFDASTGFYDEMSDFLVDGLEENYGDDVFASDFDLEDMIDDIESFLAEPINTKFTINDIYGMDIAALDENSMVESIDYIEGGVQVEAEDGYDDPTVFAFERITAFADLMEPYFDSDFWEDADVDDTIDDLEDELDEFDTEIYDKLVLASHGKTLQPISDMLEDQGLELANGTDFPSPPLEYYIPGGLFNSLFYSMQSPRPEPVMTSMATLSSTQLVYPTDFSFVDYYNWGVEAVEFLKVFAEEQEEEFPDVQVEQLIESVGINSFVVGKQGFGISWNFDDVNYDLLNQWIEDFTGETLEDDLEVLVQDGFAEVALEYSSFEGSLAYAMEFDDDMVLAANSFYLDVKGTIDYSELSDTTGMPDLDEETFEIALSNTYVRDGFDAATQNEIERGKVADERISGNPLQNIPGYPVYLVGIIGVLSTLAIITKAKKY